MPFAFTRDLLIGIVIGLLVYWAYMHIGGGQTQKTAQGVVS